MSNLENTFIQLIQLLLDDEKLQRWFISLGAMSINARTIELRNIAIQMAHSNEDENIVKLISTLVDTKIYESVRAVLLAELNQ